jgi:hypothetical protein
MSTTTSSPCTHPAASVTFSATSAGPVKCRDCPQEWPVLEDEAATNRFLALVASRRTTP